MTDISPLRANGGRLVFSAQDRARRAIDAAMSVPPDVLATIFTRFDAPRIMEEAIALDIDAKRRAGHLAGVMVSIKDLFDERGQVTGAGSTILADDQPAGQDAEAVARLRGAGAVGCGRTTMSEFAYSGVGLNPHFGNPGNVLDPARISGGSSSGGALSVALGIADVALGSDTGGSVRIPAALNGLCGFKPSQSAVPLRGTFPLSQSCDSIGPLARTVAQCSAAHAVLSASAQPSQDLRSARIAVVGGMMTDAMDVQTVADFSRALTTLSQTGIVLEDIDLPELEGFGDINRIIVSSEAHRVHAGRLDRMRAEGDPNVLRRIRTAESLRQSDEDDARASRAAAIAAFAARVQTYDAFIAPTLPTVAPLIADVQADFDTFNVLMLRNPSAINFLDGCAITVPMHAGQPLATGLMIFAPGGRDWQVLELASHIESALANSEMS
ncbi:amidase family protein [Pelagibacterium sp.]|uniref:amidase family protein n=1 Tax=Pelagibacterium sp. TaxID=1967288 RepID=UPI003A8D5967